MKMLKTEIIHGNNLAQSLTSPDLNEARIAGIIESAMDGIISVDERQRIVLFNPAAEIMFGYRASDLLGEPLDRLIPKRFRSVHREYIRSFRETNIKRRTLGRLGSIYGLRANGEEFPMEASVSQHEVGGEKLFTVILRDVTERNYVEDQLRLQSAAVEAAANAIMITDRAGKILWVNPAFTQHTGYLFDEVRGRNPRVLKSGKQDRAFYREMWETILSGKVWRDTIINRRKDGTLNHEDLTITPIRDNTGTITHFVGIKQDITERTRAEEAMQASELRYRTLFESAKDGILMLDAVTGQIVDVNPFLIQMLGYSKEDLVGKELWELGVFKDVLGSKAAFVELQEKGYIRYDDLPIKTRGGLVKQVEFVSNSYLADGSRLIQCNIRDITERKRAEEALREKSQQLEGAFERLRRAEENYRSIFENAVEGIFQSTPEGRFITVNPSFARFLGYDAPEEVITTITDIPHQLYVDPERGAEATRLQEQHGVLTDFEFEAYRKDGTKIWLSANRRAVCDENGVEVYREGTVVDITERKRAEDEKAQFAAETESHRQRLDSIIASVPGVVWEAWGQPDAATQRIDFVSDYVESLVGHSVEEWLSTPNFWLTIVHPDDREATARSARESFASGKGGPREFRWITKDGRVIWVESNSIVLKDKEGRPAGLRGVTTDITERKRAEELLRESEERYRDLVENSREIICTHDLDGKILSVNRATLQLLGYEPSDLVNKKTIQDVLAPEVRDQFNRYMKEILEKRETTNLMLVQTRSGERRILEYYNSLRTEGVEKPIVRAIARDITEPRRAEEALRQSEERYRDLVENAHDIIFSHDLLGNYTSVNRAGEQITGYAHEECLALNITETIAPEDVNRAREMMAKKLAGAEGTAYEVDILRKDGKRIAVEVNTKLILQDGVPFGVQGIARDVTERKQLEEQLRQSQKMEAIGQLAGGVAHDFNNLLTAINGYSSLALKRCTNEHDQIKSYLEEIMKAGDRAANLTRQLLAFGRKQMLQPLVLNLNDVVADINKMLRRLIGEDIKLTAKFDPALRKIKADPGQIEQILVNLVVNARDAMPQGGDLTIETANCEVDLEYASKRIGVQAGSYVMLAVSDTGTGMDDETKARVFEPFFTTKEKGKGTGLGLSTVYGIVKQSGGDIWIYSELGRGTSFKVYLPQFEPATKPTEKATAEAAAPGGSETILLVEDEDVVRGLARKVLEQAGYNVLDASGGEEAIRVCQEHTEPIHLLLTDVVMPETSGKQLAERLRSLRPTTRVLFMSGYTDEAIVHHGVVDSNVQFIQKPFTPIAFAKKVREVLDLTGRGNGENGLLHSS